jgi:phage terminase large subunit-like protein
MSQSLAEQLIESGEFETVLNGLPEHKATELLWDWDFWGRPVQQIPETMGAIHAVWLFLAGRGSGKTRTGAEATKKMAEFLGDGGRIALIAPTVADVRDVMIQGESGILSVFSEEEMPEYVPSLRRLNFKNGCVAFTYSAEQPRRLRGPQHHWAWLDEISAANNGEEMFDMMKFGLRLGRHPWAMLTGTPKRLPWLRSLNGEASTVSSKSSTYDNMMNLAPSFIRDIINRYEGTRLGRQELHADFLDDVEGALWTDSILNDGRIASFDMADPWASLNAWLSLGGQPIFTGADLRRPWKVIVAVDPPGETAECGIVVLAAPVKGKSGRDHCVVLADYSRPGRPEEWGQQVANAYRDWNASECVVEKNQGGDMTRSTIHAADPTVNVKKINAVTSKEARASPVSALYEKLFVHHVGFMPLLEAQMTTWVPKEGNSPDRVDADVHGVRWLLPDVPLASASVRSAVDRQI